jgi:hypothetical protein
MDPRFSQLPDLPFPNTPQPRIAITKAMVRGAGMPDCRASAFTLGCVCLCLAQTEQPAIWCRLLPCYGYPVHLTEQPRFHVAHCLPRSHTKRLIRWAWFLPRSAAETHGISAVLLHRSASHETAVVQPLRCGIPSTALSCDQETSEIAQDRDASTGGRLPGCCGARNYVLPL